MRRFLCVAVVFGGVSMGCGGGDKTPASTTPAVAAVVAPDTQTTPDPHSYSRPDQVRVRHIGLDWTVDFDQRQLAGSATLWIERADPEAPLWLDTRDLAIDRVEVASVPELAADASADAPMLAEVEATWSPARFGLAERDEILGQALSVELPPDATLVRVHYTTVPGATGLQWLAPPQTAEGTDPFLYSQSQAIHARSWIPCQDSPGVRVTYDARVTVPQTEGADDRVALMSASAVEGWEGEPGQFRYAMPQAVPAYLIALAVGRLSFASLGPRSGVWAEPSVVEAAAHEFAEIEKMMTVTESLYGPYRWDRYDVLVLPPAFPFGGMENPRLTFATPTILAGDRSLTSLIAHELAHSWSGNLVTNATWNDLWLNEGFTVYIERRIVEALHGRGQAEMEAMLGRQDLAEELEGLAAPADSRLRVDLHGRDPDEGLSDVAYEKGALFLRELEEAYGRAAFDPFIRRWFDDHAFTSVDSAMFEAFVAEQLVAGTQPVAGGQPARAKAWIHGEGVPGGAPEPKSDAFARVDTARAKFVEGKVPAKKLATTDWNAHQWLHFLRGMPNSVGPDKMAELDAAFDLTRSGNYEIVAQWLELGIGRGYEPIEPRLAEFLATVGRRKFLMPLYEALVAADRRADAVKIYEAARDGYHPITQSSLDKLLLEG